MKLKTAITLHATGTTEGALKGWDTRGRGRALQEGETTEEHYKDPITGQWDPERIAPYDKFMDEELAKKTPPEGRRPIAYVLGGGTASGKTTASKIILGNQPNIQRIDPDELKLLVPEFDGLKQTDPKNASARVHEESSYLTKKFMAKAMARGVDLTYDATSAGPSSLAMVQTLIDRGYDVHLKFMDVPVATAIERSEHRALYSNEPMNRGRHVPESVIRESHQRAAANFFALKDMPGVKSAELYDNKSATERGPRLVYSKTRLNPEQIHDQKYLEGYRRKALGEITSAVDRYGFRPVSYAQGHRRV